MANLKLGALINPAGVHPAGWRTANTPRNAEYDIDHYVRMAQKAEEGRFDVYFLADSPGMRTSPLEAVSRWPYFTSVLEPMTALAAIARETRSIGLAGTISTSFEQPFNVARMIASLDQISGGRAAWNAVTTASESAARNFSRNPLPSSAERYEVAAEFVELVTRLWSTWDQGAFVQDKAQGRYFDPERFHPVHFEGEHFAVRDAALNVAASPQGRPVLTQAGMSEAGRDLGARHADVVYTLAKTQDEARAFRDDLRARAVAHGRDAESIRTLVGISVLLGDSDAAAEDRWLDLQSRVPEAVGRFRVAQDLEADLSTVGWDEQIPRHLVADGAKYFSGSRAAVLAQMTTGRTLGEIARAYDRGVHVWTGNPASIADRMQEWLEAGATDGFMLSFQTLPDGLDEFVDQVVPILQERGLLRTEYQGGTLRDHLAE